MTHTLLPWELDPEVWLEGRDPAIPHYLILGVIAGQAGRTIADIGGWRDRPNAKADAAFIVLACNAYEELVAACKAVEKAHIKRTSTFLLPYCVLCGRVQPQGPAEYDDRHEDGCPMPQVQATIAKAEGVKYVG